MRGAVLDLGSQTFHAVVADVDSVGVRKVVFDRKVVMRIAEQQAGAVDLIGKLIDRTRPRAPEQCRVVATGVFRDHLGAQAVLSDACDRFGVSIETLDGGDEARLAWLGVSSELAGSHGTLAVVDLGSGSLQIAAGTDLPSLCHSVPFGTLRLRHLAPLEIRRTIAAATACAVAEVLRDAPDTFVIASGTARALLGVARRVGMAGATQRHLSTRTISDLARRLVPMAPAALASLGVASARCDTIGNGALALAAVLEQLGRPVVYVARGALREGLLVDLARSARVSQPVLYPLRRAS